jgi:hypothetical protein
MPSNVQFRNLYWTKAKFPIQKCGFFSLGKAAQGFAARRTQSTSQPEIRGERRPAGKRPFLDGNWEENMFDTLIDLILDCIFMILVLIISVLGTVAFGL